MGMEQDASLRRLATLVDRYIQLGTHLQRCRELLPHVHPSLTDINRVIAITHREMQSFESALGDLIDESMVLHEDLRQSKYYARRKAMALSAKYDAERKAHGS